MATKTQSTRPDTLTPSPTPEDLPQLITDTFGVPMALVPAGSFKMGTKEGYENESPVHTVFLGAYYIDQHEVTNKMFSRFLNVIGNLSEGGAAWMYHSGASQLYLKEGIWLSNSDYSEHPINYVTWYGARAFCNWRSARLPTEAEWEKAARGGLEGKEYPWGNDIYCSKANYRDSNLGCVGDTSPVNQYAPNGYGLYDMAGNIREWVQSEYKSYPYDAEDGREDLSSTDRRVIRGGSYGSTEGYSRVGKRDSYEPSSTGDNIGFRCAKDATP